MFGAMSGSSIPFHQGQKHYSAQDTSIYNLQETYGIQYKSSGDQLSSDQYLTSSGMTGPESQSYSNANNSSANLIKQETIQSHTSHASKPSTLQSVPTPSTTETGLLSSSHDFPFDEFLTPEYSSDNPYSGHTTPQEDIWLRDFLPQDNTIPNDLAGLGPGFSSPAQDLRSISTKDQRYTTPTAPSQLLSPQLTTTPSPPSMPPRVDSTLNASYQNEQGLMPQPMSRKRSLQSLNVETSTNRGGGMLEHTTLAVGKSPILRAVSPIVTISSYRRGDSPARADFPHARSPSRHSDRGQTGLRRETTGSQSSQGSRSPVQPIEPTGSRLMPPDQYAEDNEDTAGQRNGIDPADRGQEETLSANQISEQRQVDEKNLDVEKWLVTAETASNPDNGSRRTRPKGNRSRALSTGAQTDALGIRVFSDAHIPGPGVLINEESGDDLSDDASEIDTSSQGSNNDVTSPPVMGILTDDPFGMASPDEIPPDMDEPLPRQFFKKTLWHDVVQAPNATPDHSQAFSSNAAIVKWHQDAAQWDAASKAATWGTRRLSDGEVESIVEGSKVRHLSLSKKGRDRGASFLRNLIPRRSNSRSRNMMDSPVAEEVVKVETPVISHRESVSSIKPVQRISSFGKPKSPPLNTGGALMAMSGQLSAIGRGAPVKAEAEPLKSPLQAFTKRRSKSDAGKNAVRPKPGLAELMTRHGGPPMPTLATPMQDRTGSAVRQKSPADMADDDEDDDELMDDLGIKMNFDVRVDRILPTLEGFKTQVRQLNPRLEPALIDRIGQEQVRRYKKLVENKIKHTKIVRTTGRCASGGFCFELNGDAVLLTPKATGTESDPQRTQYQVANPDATDPDDSAFPEGAVTPAMFPPGIPPPPVKGLPAEFECPLCFKVKKFQKPSDWTKHVHEDLQPFSCTFPNCTEPKTFKRKADWVRHENERHRQLEWWQCGMQDCAHVCHRKDNFVQHLVREHKMKEPTTKGRGSSSSKAKPVQAVRDNDDEVWRLVEECHHEATKKPRDEPCRFCGNVCATWKKLSWHMGKHMEQICLPVLDLVKAQNVSADTIVSPINPAPQQLFTGLSYQPEPGNISPYTMSATSAFPGSSAAQSPSVMQISPHLDELPYDGTYYGNVPNVPHSGFGMTHGLSPQTPYATMGGNGATFTPTSHPAVHTYTSSPLDGGAMLATGGYMARPQPPMNTPYDHMYAEASLDTMYHMQAQQAQMAQQQAFASQQPPPHLSSQTFSGHGNEHERYIHQYSTLGQQQSHENGLMPRRHSPNFTYGGHTHQTHGPGYPYS